ncbi:DNA repair protein RecN [wastewater metagenome]|uniref:DNA repair protein RecN n=2 Tax=unclassified sequences TaxID=12908 RepID=A0A5B8RBV4_9ZZZZ|nr:DNA repair protein RecN [Arhodomonas sp. KWT]QEA06121.1 DNA repair protein RecN [uncultured organism]
MLRHIHIRNFTIVDRADIELDGGMTALTGETGAGKSILLDALGLCLGDRAGSGLIPEGADRTEINVQFDVADNPAAKAWLDEQDMAEDDECLLRRVLHRSGRSQAWLNGRPVPLQQLERLGRHLVDIHGQHAHQSLMRREVQRQILDDFGGYADALETVREAHRHWRTLRDEKRRLEGGGEDYGDRLELLRFQVEELEAVVTTAEDITALDAEQRRLASAGTLIETCQAALAALYDDDNAIQGQLGGVTRELDSLNDPGLEGARELLANAQVQLEEGCQELRHFLDGLEVDPERLEWVEQRLSTLTDLARKHRVRAEELPERLEALREELAGLENAETRLAELDRELAEADTAYREAAAALSGHRADAAGTLAGRINGLIGELGMAAAEMVVDVGHDADATPSAHGLDEIAFTVRTNPDQPFGPLQRVASGGELSRIGLALAVATADVSRIPTMVFDEADTGLGGAVAEVVGRKLRELGAGAQVLCITHLPQVAAQAHHQLQVQKDMDDGRTRTHITILEPEERTREIARMLGGVEITENTLNHAREMLERASA